MLSIVVAPMHEHLDEHAKLRVRHQNRILAFGCDETMAGYTLCAGAI